MKDILDILTLIIDLIKAQEYRYAKTKVSEALTEYRTINATNKQKQVREIVLSINRFRKLKNSLEESINNLSKDDQFIAKMEFQDCLCEINLELSNLIEKKRKLSRV